jgi:hypothetical protein
MKSITDFSYSLFQMTMNKGKHDAGADQTVVPPCGLFGNRLYCMTFRWYFWVIPLLVVFLILSSVYLEDVMEIDNNEVIDYNNTTQKQHSNKVAFNEIDIVKYFKRRPCQTEYWIKRSHDQDYRKYIKHINYVSGLRSNHSCQTHLQRNQQASKSSNISHLKLVSNDFLLI